MLIVCFIHCQCRKRGSSDCTRHTPSYYTYHNTKQKKRRRAVETSMV